MGRLQSVFLCVLLFSVASSAQTKYNNQLTPGESTQADVERALGRPLRTVNARVFEYTPPPGASKLWVSFNSPGGVVDLIIAQFDKPYDRATILGALNLPDRPQKSQVIEGHLRELFGAPALIALAYASEQAGSGVSQITYASPAWFALAERVGGREAPRPKLIAPVPNNSGLTSLKQDIANEQQQDARELERQPIGQEPQAPVAQFKQFRLRHRHVYTKEGEFIPTLAGWCVGVMTVESGGTVRFDCESIEDAYQQRCDHVVFPPGSINALKGGSSLHVSAKGQGNYDFFGDSGSVKGAYEAISPFVSRKK